MIQDKVKTIELLNLLLEEKHLLIGDHARFVSIDTDIQFELQAIVERLRAELKEESK